MSGTSDHSPDPDAPDEVIARVLSDQVAVRKSATPHGADAVAVYLTIQSIRDDRCEVRIVDVIPEELQGHVVEFHPRYDPSNWTKSDEKVEYTTSLAPDTERTTVYGIAVDDLDQVALFAGEPTLEVFAGEEAEGLDEDTSTDFASAFDFDLDEDDEDAAAPAAAESASTSSEPSGESEPTPSEPEGSTVSDPIEGLIDALDGRNLAEDERRTLLDALGLDEAASDTYRIDALREEVETLRDEIAALDVAETPDADRVASIQEEIDKIRDESAEPDLQAGGPDQVEQLQAELETLREEVAEAKREAEDTDQVEMLQADLDTLREEVAEGKRQAATVDRVETLRKDVESLQDDVSEANRRVADIDRLERLVASLRLEFEERQAEFAEELEQLAAVIEREATWRTRLREAIDTDPERD